MSKRPEYQKEGWRRQAPAAASVRHAARSFQRMHWPVHHTPALVRNVKKNSAPPKLPRITANTDIPEMRGQAWLH